MKRRRKSIGAASRENEASQQYTSVCFVYRVIQKIFDKKGCNGLELSQIAPSFICFRKKRNIPLVFYRVCIFSKMLCITFMTFFLDVTRRRSEMLLELGRKIRRVFISAAHRYLGYRQIRGDKRVVCFFKPY